jgi:spoIIIJ-associated protein
MADLETFLKEKTEETLDKMGLPSKVTLKATEDRTLIELKPQDEEDTSLLIGYHGQTLNALQIVLRNMVFKNFNEAPSILVETGGYREEREDELTQRALEAADKARFLLKEVSFPAMSSYERRVIHMALAEEKGVRTESRGEGRERHTVVIPEGVETKEDKKE